MRKNEDKARSESHLGWAFLLGKYPTMESWGVRVATVGFLLPTDKIDAEVRILLSLHTTTETLEKFIAETEYQSNAKQDFQPCGRFEELAQLNQAHPLRSE